MVNVDKIKMSKSLGNFRTIKDLLKNYSGEIIRYFVISTQYRKPIDFSKKALDEAKISYQRLKNIISEIKSDNKVNKEYLEEFEKAMSDDLNTAKALQVLWKLIRDEKANGKIKTIEKIDKVFRLNLLKKEKVSISKEVQKLVKEREKARKEKDFKKADELREKIKKLGYVIDDTNKGAKIKKI